MATSSKICVGVIGASPNRGFASIAHIPALRALPEFEISAVCTTRQDLAEAAARHFGIPLAFSDPERLARHPDVDLVTVGAKMRDHYRPVMAITKYIVRYWAVNPPVLPKTGLPTSGVRHGNDSDAREGSV